MNREEQIRTKAQEFLPDNILDDEYPYRAEFAFGFQTGAKWADENPKHYSFKEAMDACMGSYEAGGKELLYVANQTAERTKKEVISKACEWLEDVNTDNYMDSGIFQMCELIRDFKKAMES